MVTAYLGEGRRHRGEEDMIVNAMQPERKVIQMEGTFDLPAAKEVAAALEAAPAGLEVRLDLTRVREFHDFSVAILARAIQGRRVDIRGLRTHQLRLLRYMGVEVVDPAVV
jgi:hypothetical protein